jgi:hypothetical protein
MGESEEEPHVDVAADNRLFIPLFLMGNVYFAVTIALFLWTRHHPNIQSRQPLTTVLMSLHFWGLYLIFVAGLHISESFEVTCSALLTGIYFMGVPAMLLLMIKTGNLLFVYILHNTAGQHSNKPFLETFNKLEQRMFRLQSVFQYRHLESRPSTRNASNNSSGSGHSGGSNSVVSTNSTTKSYSKAISKKALAMILIFGYLIGGVLSIISYYAITGDAHECETKDMLLLTPFILVMVFIICPLFIYTIRKVNDSLGLRLEIQLSLAAFLILYAFSLLSIEIVKSLQPGMHSIGYFLFYSFIQQTILVTIPAIRALLPSNAVLSLTPEDFRKVLADPKKRESFKQVLAKDFCSENMVFWECVEKLKQNDKKMSASYFLAHFFRSGAEYELNLPAKRVKEIRSRLLENAENSLEVLLSVQIEVADMMYRNNFHHFLALKKSKDSTSTLQIELP